MTRQVPVGPITVQAEDPFEGWRAETAFTKEPGTIRWLDMLGPGDVLYDIGANIGIYTLLAAERVGPTGHVYAFEPHVVNAAALLRNVGANGFQDRVTVITAALGWVPHVDVTGFAYRSLRAGSSGSQLGHCRGEDGKTFAPTASEMKLAVTLDWLLPYLRDATAIKIDVDGNELQILQGMVNTLRSQVLRSVQVEIHPADRLAIVEYMQARGFDQTGAHFTANGQRAIDRGSEAATITYNAVFARAA